MRFVSLLIAFLLVNVSLINAYNMSDTHIYKGRYTNTSDILYTWDGKHLYGGRYSNTSDILYTWDGRHLYRGRYTNTSDILMSFDGMVPVVVFLVGM